MKTSRTKLKKNTLKNDLNLILIISGYFLIIFCNNISADNIIKNPSFEKNWQEYWQAKQYRNKNSIVSSDTANKHTGNKSIKVYGTSKTAVGLLYQLPIEVKPGEKYKFNIWCKTENIQPTAPRCGNLKGILARITFGDQEGNSYGNIVYQYEKYAQGPIGTNTWVELSKEFTVPLGLPFNARKCFIGLFVQNTEGIVWFDDINLKKIGDETTCSLPSESYPEQISLKALRPNIKGFENKRTMLQIWPGIKYNQKGNPSIEIITKRDKWIPKLKNKYGIEALIVMAMEHGNVGTGMVSDEELKNAIADYQKNGIKIILYTSLMHVSHDLSWHEVVKNHPQWLIRNQFGDPENFFLNARLCYNTPAFKHCLNHIIKMVNFFNPDGIMLDNQYHHSTCYCKICQEKFKKYISSKFNKNKIKICFNIDNEDFKKLKITDNIDSRLFREYVEWQQIYSCAKAIEETRKALRQIKPDIILGANISPQFYRSSLIHPYDYEDLIIFEGSPLDSKLMLERLFITQAIAKNKPVYDYEYTWKHPKISQILPPKKLCLNFAIIFACNSIPLFPCYGFDSIPPRGIYIEELKAISKYLLFFKKNKSLFLNYSGIYTNIAASIPNPYGKRKGALLPLINGNLPFQPIRTINKKNLKEKKILFLLESRSLVNEEINQTKDFVKNGGTLIFSKESGKYDEFVEKRIKSGIFETFNLKKNDKKTIVKYGHGNVIFLSDTNTINNAVQKALAKCFLKIDSSSEKINAIPYIQHKNNSSATNKIIIHYLNHNLDQETKNIKTTMVLPKNFKIKDIEYTSPDTEQITNIPYKITEYNAEKTISFTIPKLLIYGIISISNNNLK